MRLVCNINSYCVNTPISYCYNVCVYYITNTIINRQYLLSSVTVVSLSLPPKHPPNCITHTVVGDTFHNERDWLHLLVTDSGILSYKMEYCVLYDIIIMMLMILLQN